MSTALFAPVKLGAVAAPNRFLMAPLTRCRADKGHLPTAAMATHYADRASAGLLIAEATMVSAAASSFMNEPGIYNDEQVAAWKKVTDAVHAKGGRIALQIFHPGRAAVALNNEGGVPPVAPTAVTLSHTVAAEFNPTGEKIPYDEPRELADDELPEVLALFVAGAKNAIAAGFDAVEVHAANGYLLDNFLRESGNKRAAPYGGSLEARARFPLEVVAAVVEAIGADRVGVRISPLNSYQDMLDSDPAAVTAHVAAKLSALDVAFLHVMRADFFGVQKGVDVVKVAREHFAGTLVANMGYDAAEAAKAIDDKLVDAVAFGTKFLANPDFVERTKAGAELNEMRPQFLYTTGHEGYNDYAPIA